MMHTGMRKVDWSEEKKKKKKNKTYMKMERKLSPEEQAMWDWMHVELIDDLLVPLVEEALNEAHEKMYRLLNDYVVVRASKPKMKSMLDGSQFFQANTQLGQSPPPALPGFVPGHSPKSGPP